MRHDRRKYGFTIDHVLIAVRDLGKTAQVFNHLGFTVTPEGVHPGRGSRNRLVVFGGEYLELITVTDPNLPLFRPNMADFLKSREGIFIFSMGTSDIEMAFSQAKSRGLKIGEPVCGARHSSGGIMEYSWRQAEIGQLELPGSQTFFIQHDHDIEQRYRDPVEAWEHSNGAQGIYSLTLVVNDAVQAADQWRSFFDLENTLSQGVHRQADYRVGLAFENASLEFLSPTGPGEIQDFLDNHGDGPFSMAIRVKDLKGASKLLSKRNIPYDSVELDGMPACSILPEYVQGIPLTLVQG